MATVSAYRNGTTMGMAGRNASPAKRGVIKGWSSGAVRRHTRWLYSIDAPQLDGVGVALTLTLRATPDTAADWVRLRRAFVERARRLGMIRLHWVTEWQRRGAPHMHLAVYAPEGTDARTFAESLLLAWIDVARGYEAGVFSQYWDEIAGPLGWLKYLSKHAARGVKHYQRQGAPQGWDVTGRLWGHAGDWPADEPMRFELSTAGYHRLRRLIRSWRIADARAAGDRRRIRYARRMLMCPDRKLSAVRGVSDWVPEDVLLELVSSLELDGYSVTQIAA
jgi:hypothetical protein